MTTTTLASRASRRRAIAFTALLGVSLVLMAISSSPMVLELQRAVGFAVRPVMVAFDSAAEGVAGVFGAIGEIDRLYTDNEALRRENDRLTAANLRLEAAQRENELLTGLLQLQNSFAYDTAAAEVIARDSSEARRAVTISKGEDAGIEVGDVVIAEGGALAGRVVEVGSNFAHVVLITDRSSTVIGKGQIGEASGEVIGQLGGSLIMQNIPSVEEIELGEEVTTAGIELAGGIRSPYPKGLLLGTVVDVRRDANSIVQTAYLQPTADLEKIEYVLVVLDYDGGLPSPDDTPIDCSLTGEDGVIPGGEQPCIEPSPSPSPSGSAGPAASASVAP